MTIEEYLTEEPMKLKQDVSEEFQNAVTEIVIKAFESKAVTKLLLLEVKSCKSVDDLLARLPKCFAMGFYYGRDFSEVNQLEKIFELEQPK